MTGQDEALRQRPPVTREDVLGVKEEARATWQAADAIAAVGRVTQQRALHGVEHARLCFVLGRQLGAHRRHGARDDVERPTAREQLLRIDRVAQAKDKDAKPAVAAKTPEKKEGGK